MERKDFIRTSNLALFLFLASSNVIHIFVNFMDETPVSDHSNESYRAVLSCGTVYYAVQGGSNF